MLKERIQQLKNELGAIQDWDQRYEKIISLGKALPPLPKEDQNEKNLVKGCQSQVWLVAELNSEGKVIFKADSDAMIVKGLIALLVSIYSNSTPDDILTHPPVFLKELGFDQNLSPNRANGLYSMVKQMQFYAFAFRHQLQSKK